MSGVPSIHRLLLFASRPFTTMMQHGREAWNAWAWIYAGVSVLRELAPLLRYHYMTTDFLANVMCRCSLMQLSGLLPAVVGSAIVQREALPSLLEENEKGKRDRGVGALNAIWELKAGFTLEEVAALEIDKAIQKWCGLVAGYAASLSVGRYTEQGGTSVILGAILFIHMPGNALGEGDTPLAGVGLHWDMTLPPDTVYESSNFFNRPNAGDTLMGWGEDKIFDKPWEEVEREGSPHFPGGTLEVKSTVKLAKEE